MGWWFGRKSAPAGRGFLPTFLQDGETSAGFVRGYAAQLDEVYRRNPVGQRSVRLVAGMVGGLTIHAAEGDDEMVALVTRDGLLEEVAAGLLLHGNAYPRGEQHYLAGFATTTRDSLQWRRIIAAAREALALGVPGCG